MPTRETATGDALPKTPVPAIENYSSTPRHRLLRGMRRTRSLGHTAPVARADRWRLVGRSEGTRISARESGDSRCPGLGYARHLVATQEICSGCRCVEGFQFSDTTSVASKRCTLLRSGDPSHRDVSFSDLRETPGRVSASAIDFPYLSKVLENWIFTTVRYARRLSTLRVPLDRRY